MDGPTGYSVWLPGLLRCPAGCGHLDSGEAQEDSGEAQEAILNNRYVLLGVVIWLIKKLLLVLECNSEVIARNTEAIRDLTSMTCDLLRLNRSLHDKIISRPCIAKQEGK